MPRRTNDTRDTVHDRPAIWIDGRQQPRFDLRAWARVGHAMARRGVVPKLAVASGLLSRLGEQIAEGHFAPVAARLGRVGRLLPSRQLAGATVTGLAARLEDARLILDPAPEQPGPLAYPNVIRGPVCTEARNPAAIVLPHPAPPPRSPEVEPTLATIRAVLRRLPEDAPHHLPPLSPQVREMPKQDAPQNGLSLLFTRGLSHLIAFGALALAMPVGLGRATLFHLNGGDLANWD